MKSERDSIRRYYKDRLYIGVQSFGHDAWGNRLDVSTAKLFQGKPPGWWYGDEVYEYTPAKWDALRDKIRAQAAASNRELFEGTDPGGHEPVLTYQSRP